MMARVTILRDHAKGRAFVRGLAVDCSVQLHHLDELIDSLRASGDTVTVVDAEVHIPMSSGTCACASLGLIELRTWGTAWHDAGHPDRGIGGDL